ncbi:GNAT family N-acetyltransferase [Desulfitobacterium sp. Sab5]|uniref:GNAT family N-acetyltransferase n=1 Tax=Desulfitobacterium nosdiversum TaxID=3375356 RepID=UPI003CE94A0D
MNKVRLALKGEVERQKEIWKRCFGDEDRYIDFYYDNRYKEAETMVLLYEGEISAMLTMIPIQVVTPDQQIFPAAMLYAIATDPQRQSLGLATQLMDYSHEYLGLNNITFSILVPAGKSLFDFYHKRSYHEGFYLRELLLTREEIETWNGIDECLPKIFSISSNDYNQRRNQQLKGSLHIAYADKEIDYQKKLSQLSGADIYAIDLENTKGCGVIERINPDEVIVKEILLPEEFLISSLYKIAELFPAQKYIIRTPAFRGQLLGGEVRAFGMVRPQNDREGIILVEEQGYLGLAFD